ncbi:MAG: DUF4249 domain-containing protein [Cyclobacteriaceae bacterium]|jgi:hypothetical protein
MYGKYIIYVLFVFLSGCISSYNLENDNSEPLLVVDGKITQENTQHELTLRRSTATGSTEFNAVTGARISLNDDIGNFEAYYESGNGKYLLEGSVLERVPGRSYYLEIQLPDERIYRSVPQTMPEVMKPDKLYFKLEEIEEISDLENIIIKRYLNLYVNTPVSKDNLGFHFIWRVDHAYSFAELQCSPLKPPVTCYITRKLISDNLKIFTSEDLSGGILQDFRVGSIRVLPNWEFFEKHFFNVAQHSITREAYVYWETVKKVAQSTGSIFDTPPGPINGNIYNVNDPEERILGFFEVSAVDTIRTYTFATDLEPLAIEDLCNPLVWQSWRNPECCDCLLIPDSHLQRPEYWGFLREDHQ